MKQTAVQWLVNQLNKDGFAQVITNEEIDQALEMELEQRKEDFRKGWQGNKHKDWNCEFYLIKHINNDFQRKD